MRLFSHQQTILDDDPKKCGLFLGTGSGKTRIALLLARGTTLVITTKTIRDAKVWENEATKIHLPHPLILSKEDFKKRSDTLHKSDTLILDEAHTMAGISPSVKYRNKRPIPKTSQIYSKILEYIEKNAPERLYALTATSIRSPMSVYGIATILGRTWDFYQFRDTFYVPFPNKHNVYLPKKSEKVKDELAALVRKLGYTGQLSDYFDVPEQTVKDIYVEQTKGQKERLESIPLEYPDPLVLAGKRHQVANGVLKGDEFNPDEYIKDNKIDTIVDLAHEFPKMVVFARYKMQLRKIASSLNKQGFKTVVIDGETTNRDVLIRYANDNDCVAIIQSAISEGYELPNIPVMVFASLDWSIVSYIQAIGRIQRAGKLKKNLYIHLITKDTIDEKVHEAIMNKQDFMVRIYE